MNYNALLNRCARVQSVIFVPSLCKSFAAQLRESIKLFIVITMAYWISAINK